MVKIKTRKKIVKKTKKISKAKNKLSNKKSGDGKTIKKMLSSKGVKEFYKNMSFIHNI